MLLSSLPAGVVGAAFLAIAACGGGAESARDASPAPADAAASTAAASPDSIVARADQARIQGAADAPVWMVVVSDFQCPYCAQWHAQSYEALKREYVDAGKVRMAYLNLPLPNHRHAWPAAETAMCAGLQGKFWEMHDAIFHTQARWTALADATPVFDSLATAEGLNLETLRQCVSSDVLRPLIQSDYDRVAGAGVTGTPAFFIGDQVISGLGPTSAYRAAIDSALAAAGRGGATERR